MAHLREHSPAGSSLTQRRYQGARDPVYAWEAELKRMRVPTLLALGDEDWPCLLPGILMKQNIPSAALAVSDAMRGRACMKPSR